MNKTVPALIAASFFVLGTSSIALAAVPTKRLAETGGDFPGGWLAAGLLLTAVGVTLAATGRNKEKKGVL